MQAGLVLLLFAIPNSQAVLSGVTAAVDGLADAADKGAQFVFGYLSGGDQPYASPTIAPPRPSFSAFACCR